LALHLDARQMATTRAFGLECPERVDWKGWRPGGEYIKTITIKNVSPKTVKFKCKQPTSKAFSMEFSEYIMLSAGMHYHLKVRAGAHQPAGATSCAAASSALATVQVIFRPPAMEAIADVIDIVSPLGECLTVAITATLPATQLQVPSDHTHCIHCMCSRWVAGAFAREPLPATSLS
jgi:hypothetical protein